MPYIIIIHVCNNNKLITNLRIEKIINKTKLIIKSLGKTFSPQ